MINFEDFEGLRQTGEYLLSSDLCGPPAARAWRAKVIAWLRANRPDSKLANKAAMIPAPRDPLNSSTGRGLQRYDRNNVRQLQKMLLEAEASNESDTSRPNDVGQGQRSTRGSIEETRKLVFISHSSKDADLSDAVVDLLCTALNLRRRDFRCTSAAGTTLPGGVDTASALRADIRSVPVFLSILTPAGLASHYVLFELGARWGADMFHIPLLAKGVRPDVIKEPLKAINALHLDEAESVFKLIGELGERLGVKPEHADAYHKKLLDVVRLAKKSQTIVSPRVSRALARYEAGRTAGTLNRGDDFSIG